MKSSRFSAAMLLGLALLAPRAVGQTADAPRLRVLTINVWSGLDYEGVFKFGEYESADRRGLRYTALVEQIRKLDPDIVFVQEANFTGRAARRLADALGFDEIHQVVNGGIKLGPLGLPVNFKEGMAILAKPALNLKRHDVWKLSGPFGLFGDVLTIQFSEAVFALVGRVMVNATPLYLVNVHLVASPPDEEMLFQNLAASPERGATTDAELAQTVADIKARNSRRMGEVRRLVGGLNTLPEGAPVVIAGDFNADREAPEIKEFITSTGATDTLTLSGERNATTAPGFRFTWDPGLNENIEFSRRSANASGEKRRGLAWAEAVDSGIGRRIDYIFLNKNFRPEDMLSSTVTLDAIVSGVRASDHFGVAADIDLRRVCETAPQAPPTVVRPAKFTKDFFPILMWDTDIGFGYGLKTFLLNPLGRSESFDLTLFNSSKGERWYRFVFSLPDFETRQGKIYPLAFDLTIDYDKMIKNNFFGVGNTSRYEDRVKYTREPLAIDLAVSRGFTPTTVGQIGLKYATIENSVLEGESESAPVPYSLDLGRVSYVSIFGKLRYDSRDSFIHPSEGLVLQAEAEYAPGMGSTRVHFARLAGWFQYYTVLFYPKTVFAFRLGGQSLFGDNLPTQVLLPLGGNLTLRGSPQDRFLDMSHVLMNAELRFPIIWRLGGVVGLDAGKVWPSLANLDFRGWMANPTIGLRFYMATFVVRVDVGLGREATGLYFNFGHIF